MQARASSTIERLDQAKKKLQKYQQKRNINPLASHDSLTHPPERQRFASSSTSDMSYSSNIPPASPLLVAASTPMLSAAGPSKIGVIDTEAVLVEQGMRDYDELEQQRERIESLEEELKNADRWHGKYVDAMEGLETLKREFGVVEGRENELQSAIRKFESRQVEDEERIAEYEVISI
jgi:DNA repair exonuclease SbcCD ATPase subunit